jgi:DNA repair protein RadC
MTCVQFDGVGDAKATLILAAMEFARRRIKPEGAKIRPPPTCYPTCGTTPTASRSIFLCASYQRRQ